MKPSMPPAHLYAMALSDTNMTMPTADAAYSPRPQDIIPHVALPFVLVLSLFSPPFPLRGICFVALIAVTEWACTVSAWPPNVGNSRPLKYGLASSWYFVLPVLEKMLVHVPERDFWRVDDEAKPEHERRPAEFTWAKAWWALALFATPRAVGWNFGSRKFNALREAAKKRAISRGPFVVAKIWRAFLAYVALDAVVIAARKVGVPSDRTWDSSSILWTAYLELLMGISTYAAMTIQFEIVAAIGVAMFLSKPEVRKPNILLYKFHLSLWGPADMLIGLAAAVWRHHGMLYCC
jgi:GNAT superfamily N-acetyltransferase